MQVKSIAECSKGSILQYFWPSLSYHLLRSLFCLFLSGLFTQVLLYDHFMVISYNYLVNKFCCHNMTMLYTYLCYNEVCYKETALYLHVFYKNTMFEIALAMVSKNTMFKIALALVSKNTMFKIALALVFIVRVHFLFYTIGKQKSRYTLSVLQRMGWEHVLIINLKCFW